MANTNKKLIKSKGNLKNETNYRNVKYFYDNEELVYDGNYKNGRFHGIGKLYINGKIMYDGNFKNGRFNGNGKLYYENGVKSNMTEFLIMGKKMDNVNAFLKMVL